MFTFIFVSPARLCLETKLPSLFTTGYSGNYWSLSACFRKNAGSDTLRMSSCFSTPCFKDGFKWYISFSFAVTGTAC